MGSKKVEASKASSKVPDDKKEAVKKTLKDCNKLPWYESFINTIIDWTGWTPFACKKVAKAAKKDASKKTLTSKSDTKKAVAVKKASTAKKESTAKKARTAKSNSTIDHEEVLNSVNLQEADKKAAAKAKALLKKAEASKASSKKVEASKASSKVPDDKKEAVKKALKDCNKLPWYESFINTIIDWTGWTPFACKKVAKAAKKDASKKTLTSKSDTKKAVAVKKAST